MPVQGNEQDKKLSDVKEIPSLSSDLTSFECNQPNVKISVSDLGITPQASKSSNQKNQTSIVLGKNNGVLMQTVVEEDAEEVTSKQSMARMQSFEES